MEVRTSLAVVIQKFFLKSNLFPDVDKISFPIMPMLRKLPEGGFIILDE